MAHSPLACQVMEKSYQEAIGTAQLFAALQSLNNRMDRLTRDTQQIEERIGAVKQQAMEIAAFQAEQVKK